MNSLIEFFAVLIHMAQWLVLASLKTIPLIALVFIIQRLLRNRISAASRHLLWLSVLISLSIPFGWNLHINHSPNNFTEINVPATSETLPLLSHPESQTNNAVNSTQITEPESITSTSRKFEWSENIYIILTAIWLGVTALLAGLTLTRAYYFQRIKERAQPAPAQLSTLFLQCKTEMNANNSIQLLSTAEIQSPITLGWLSPAIVLPHNIENFPADKLKHILLHELGHIKRQDILFNWVACAINILHWFNPMVWLACRRMRMDMACDALVLSHLHQAQRKDYGATLIEISEIPRRSRRAATTVGILENHAELKERLTMIKEFTAMNMKSTLIFSILLLSTAITALAQPAVQSTALTTTNSTKSIEASGTALQEFAMRAEKDLKIKVLVGQKYAATKIQVNFSDEKLNYGQMLTQLKINEFTAYKSKDYVQIVPIDEARWLTIPIVEKGKTYFEDEVVTDYLKTEKACSGKVLATIRPLIPQYGHLTSYEDEHSLIIIDTYGNIQRIKNVIKSLEANLTAPMNCKDIAK